MRTFDPIIHRRRFFHNLALGTASLSALWVPGVFAEELTRTPPLTEGPFYPDKFPLDTDNDLIIINDKLTPAVGEVTYLSGTVRTTSGSPVRNALVEIWQVDNNGAYLHSRSGNAERRDANFQGFGRFLTGPRGEYYFRTIKPVPYPGRAPHIHVIVKQGERRLLTTQLLIKGHDMNARDGVFRAARDPKSRELLLVDFTPLKGSTVGELEARFDIVVGLTPEEREPGTPPRPRRN